MGRKTDREILRENCWLTVLSTAFILCGIWIALLPHLLPFASYDSLQETEATVQSFKHFYGGAKGLNDTYLLTTDNEKYILSGDYDHEEAAALLTAGKSVTLKWYQRKPFGGRLAEEVMMDGKPIVRYDNDLGRDKKASFFAGAFLAAVGTGGLLLLNLTLKTNRKKQTRRDEKLKRKYGKNARVGQNSTGGTYQL